MGINTQTTAEQTRSRLRINTALVTKALESMPSELQATFAEVVKDLDLGPEPELAECSTCHHMGMRAATICSHCWTKLTPH